MNEKKVLDLNSIVSECGIFDDIAVDVAIQKLNGIENKYSKEEVVVIYNHFLTVCKNQDVLMYLVRCVDKYREKSSLSIIVELLLDKENSVNLRAMCAKAIANFKDTSAVTPLLYCLNDKDENYKLRLACADALGRVGDKYAVAPLINIVQDEEEKSVYVRESAAVALGMLGDLRAIDPLVSILETKKGFLDKFTFLKERVIEVLGKFNFSSERVFNALKHSLTDESPQIRINAIEALMDSEDERAYDTIKEMLDDLDDEVKKNALIALYNLRGREILDEVIEDKKYCDFLKTEAQSLIDEYE
ncbi:MAG: HEAT repeat domain-containing protein [Candidatus Gastranaerophilales bacterium]|nr:HEAT repeat domain-containing protein [Candidatus Gastranaerophilales bacterium]